MDWLDCLNEAVEYIEQHITEEIDYGKLAETLGVPAYYFQKMFAGMADISLSEYIRRRRMSLAAVELINSSQRILDISLKYGYNSPTAFNRAFQGVHGASPSMVKKGLAPAAAYPALHFSMSVKGAEKLDFRMEKKEGFRILGVSCPLDEDLEKNFEKLPRMWDQALSNGTLGRLLLYMDGQPSGLLGVSVHHTDKWKYLIAVSSSKTPQMEERLDSYLFPDALWAVFTGKGTNQSLQELERRVITEWLPSSGYEYAEIPDVEVYLKADPNDCEYEYWLPVIPAGL